MFSRLFHPHIGGVEKHVLEISKRLVKKGHDVIIFTEKYNSKLSISEIFQGARIIRIAYPKTKYFGLLKIWSELWKRFDLIKKVDIVHCHDVFVWYLPFRLLFPRKKIYTTFHGWEGKYPIPFINKMHKKLANVLSVGSISIGKYIQKYYGVTSNTISYGAVDVLIKHTFGKKKGVVFVGRLDGDTGLPGFLKDIEKGKYKDTNIKFVGDGNLREECQKYGRVYGFVTNINPFLRKAKVCVPAGYLTALSAMANNCKVKVYPHNELKHDYWEDAPFYKYIKDNDVKGAYNWAKKQTWEKLLKTYLVLWKVEK